MQKAIKEKSFHTAQIYLDKSLWNQWHALHKALTVCTSHHCVCIGESIRESAETA